VSVVALSIAPLPTRAGHESPFYPSFYPQEIRVETVEPAAAVAGWAKARVHAYIGSDPFEGTSVPQDAAAVVSLRALVVLTFDGRERGKDARTRCAMAGALRRTLDAQAAHDFVALRYPITPYHADFLQHFDRVTRAREEASKESIEPGAIRVRSKGTLAQALVPATLRAESDWDVTLEEIGVDTLVDPSAFGPGNFMGAPWAKQGWFQAYRLYAETLSDPKVKRAAGALYGDLVTGRYRDNADRMNRERALVAALTSSCERVVLGYTLRREYLNTEYSAGAENAGFDAQTGFTAAIFPRTVKLKDFPWNGWLRVGTAKPPASAWNPIGGMNDTPGRLVWLAIGDPALLPAPYGGTWIDNRVRVDASVAGPVTMPADALRPTSSGALERVGPGKVAQQKLTLAVAASAFHDGTSTEFADLVYPFVLAFRLSDPKLQSHGMFDPAIAGRTEVLRAWLAGFKRVGEKTEVLDFGDDLKFRHRMEIVEVYLSHRSSDRFEAAAAAAPWSTLPWEVLVLMEEAVKRGVGAFSQAEAQRRNVPWLDLVRDPETGVRLSRLVDEFRDQGYRPEALQPLVTQTQARERWEALARFYAERKHFLVTNGPYELASAAPDGAVLKVFRDLSYPKGVGSMDVYAIPLRAFVTGAEVRGRKLVVHAEVEHIVRGQRAYEIERTPLEHDSLEHTDDEERPECRYLVIDATGKVLRAGNVASSHGGEFIVALDGLPPARYNVVLALYVQGNAVGVEPKIIEYRPAEKTTQRDEFRTIASH